MKSVIIYYSYSGNTRKVADVLSAGLMQKGEVKKIELASLDEPVSFFSQAHRAFFRRRARIKPAGFDLSGYDLVCFGTPVWAFAPAPAMNTYLDECSGLKGKPVVLFTTYGSGTGNQRCMNYMQSVLTRKGAGQFKRFSVQQFKVNTPEFINAVLKEAGI